MDHDSLIEEFVNEAKEHLENIEGDLIALEEDIQNADEGILNRIFRAIHTVKGGTGFFQDKAQNLKELSHAQEDLLVLIRTGKLSLTEEIVSTLLVTVDKLSEMLDHFETSDEEDISEYTQNLYRLAREDHSCKESLENQELEFYSLKLEAGEPMAPFKMDFNALKEVFAEYSHLYHLRISSSKLPQDFESFDAFEQSLETTGKILHHNYQTFLETHQLLYATVLEQEFISNLTKLSDQCITEVKLQQIVPSSTEEVEAAQKLQKELGELARLEKTSSSEQAAEESQTLPSQETKEIDLPKGRKESSLRVNVKVLDDLMTLMGELVLSRNNLLQLANAKDADNFHSGVEKLSSIISNLQGTVMDARMQPIKKVFNKFKRIARDLSHSLNKKIQIHLEDNDVDLDKSILEVIGDPLIHLVRNSLDHGIESIEERENKGKDPTGNLWIRAQHDANQVVLEIEDDGAGIDVAAIKEKASNMEAFAQQDLDSFTKEELIQLIFHPGFSTAETVTDVSGRGVGMDVVNTNLSKIGGSIHVHSELNKGTKLEVKLPLTMAILPCFISQCESQNFLIPQGNICEMLSLDLEEAKATVQRVDKRLVVRLRDQLLYTTTLSQVLDLDSNNLFTQYMYYWTDDDKEELYSEEKKAEIEEKLQEDFIDIFILKAGSNKFALIVDRILGSEEIVIKPLGQFIRNQQLYSGMTIQGDGSVTPILDPTGIALISNLNEKVQSKQHSPSEQMSEQDMEDRESFFIFNYGEDEFFAVPRDIVLRVEKIKESAIHSFSGRPSIRSRENILPLFKIDELAQVQAPEPSEELFVLVFRIANHEVGVIASRVLGSFELSLNIDQTTFKQKGVLGSMLYEDKAVLFIDVYSFVTQLYPEWMKKDEVIIQKLQEDSSSILVVEDSNFFRNHFSSFLEGEGYKVDAVENGQVAWQKLQKQSERYSLVITDIDMPVMDGLELIREIRSAENMQDLPVIGVSGLAQSEDVQRALSAGANRYLIKLDNNELIQTIDEVLGGKL